MQRSILGYRVVSCLTLIGASAVLLTGCSGIETEAKYPTGADRNQTADANDIYSERSTIFGEGGIMERNKRRKKSAEVGSGVAVNSFLWRATLDTVSFMPLASADPFGGVILTDWYSDPANPDERVKVNAFVLTRELEADGIRVRAFRQLRENGEWVDAPTSEQTARQLEDTILTRARQLRVAHLEN